jgi:hypothetical protein
VSQSAPFIRIYVANSTISQYYPLKEKSHLAGTAKKKTTKITHADYTKALRTVGGILSHPNLPKAHSKLLTGFQTLTAEFATHGRDWMKPATATATPAPPPKKAVKTKAASPAAE